VCHQKPPQRSVQHEAALALFLGGGQGPGAASAKQKLHAANAPPYPRVTDTLYSSSVLRLDALRCCVETQSLRCSPRQQPAAISLDSANRP